MDQLFVHFHSLLNGIPTTFIRSAYLNINWKNRMIGLTGPRGVGKTTLLLQHIKQNLNTSDTLYVIAEDFYFATNRLLDLAATFVKQGGRYLFIDEIHKYPDWSKELKLIYDYYPDLHVIFSGSSILDIKKGAADLSRRAVMYHMQGLSFREYLELFHDIKAPIYTLKDILQHKVRIPDLTHPLPLFKQYLQGGYYPFSIEEDYDIRLQQVIIQSLETDVPLFAGLNANTGRKLKQLLGIIAKSVPFKPNFSKIAEMLSVSRNSIADYCIYIEEAGLIAQLRDATKGIRSLGKVNKIYLDNTNLVYSLAKQNANKGNIRETFFLNQTRTSHDVVASPVADFRIDAFTFEVGGKNKTKKQIQKVNQAYIIKDDIETGYMQTIPLWHFGLMY